MSIRVRGSKDAPVLVVCDAPNQDDWQDDIPISGKAYDLFKSEVQRIGFTIKDFCFVSPCPPVPDMVAGSDARERKHLEAAREEFRAAVAECAPALIVTLGKMGVRQMTEKPVKITRVRGKLQEYEGLPPVLPMLSPYHVIRKPEMADIFSTDMHMLSMMRDADWAPTALESRNVEAVYEWCTDLSHVVELVDKGQIDLMAVDTETTGLRWYMPEVVPLTVQLSYEEGRALVIPVDCDYYPELTPAKLVTIKNQLRHILATPEVFKCGHNIKYDHHILRQFGIDAQGWAYDNQLLAFMIDENMTDKSQDECVRRWVPAMAGYADEYNQKLDKSNMRTTSHDDMLGYGGGDADAALRLTKALLPLAKKDKRQWNCYRKIVLPTTDAFMSVLEPQGIHIDTGALANLQRELDVRETAEYDNLISQVPRALRKKHAEKGLKFSRPDFVRDILFTKEGFGFKPKVFTKTTSKLGKSEQIASTSAKDHLPYFDDEPFVVQLMDFQRLTKLRSTYVGHPAQIVNAKEEPATGFWQYLHNGKIHPSFHLGRTVTGRTNSDTPNSQNFPKRGRGSMKEVVKAFRRIFRAPDGWKLIEADLSQIELRIVAWMAREATMLRLFNEGSDLHAATAARTMGMSMDAFLALDKETKDMKRFQAKSVNFGYVFGMWWKKFKVYAKTDYGLDLTDEQAAGLRETFFDLYSGLVDWHENTRRYVNENGMVRALHGAVRHLPSIYSADKLVQQECERQAINSPVQRFGSDLGVMALHRLSRDCPTEVIVPVAFIHDALVVMVRDDYVEEAMAATKWYMQSNPLREWFGITPPLPILADVSVGQNLADMEEQKQVEAVRPSWHQRALDL